MKIIFSSLGFSSAEVFLTDISDKFPGQYQIGFMDKRYSNELKFFIFPICLYKFKNIIPTPEQILEEYKRQYAIKGVCINPDGIVYSG